MRSKRLKTQHGPIEAPPDFLFIPLVVRSSDQLKPHLNHHLVRTSLCAIDVCYLLTSNQNDHLILSHFHDPTDGYVHLEENADWLSDGQSSASSVVRKSDAQQKNQSLAVHQKVCFPSLLDQPLLMNCDIVTGPNRAAKQLGLSGCRHNTVSARYCCIPAAEPRCRWGYHCTIEHAVYETLKVRPTNLFP